MTEARRRINGQKIWEPEIVDRTTRTALVIIQAGMTALFQEGFSQFDFTNFPDLNLLQNKINVQRLIAQTIQTQAGYHAYDQVFRNYAFMMDHERWDGKITIMKRQNRE